MSPIGINSALPSLLGSRTGRQIGLPTLFDNGPEALAGSDFRSSLSLRMASLQAQSFDSFIGSIFAGKTPTDINGASEFLFGVNNALASPQGSPAKAQELSPEGYNVSLADPRAAFAMMSLINTQDVSYKAQFAEMRQMQTGIATLRQAAQQLSETNTSMDDEVVATHLREFVAQYNAWSSRFEKSVGKDGVLKGTQAAEVALHEFKQSLESMFNGASDGIRGLKDLGVALDRSSNTATFDASKLESVLSSNRQGTINAIGQFSASFSKSAELLNSSNNFIPNRLDNLGRAIDYIDDHKTAWQSEFGLGTPASVSPSIAKALEAYNKTART